MDADRLLKLAREMAAEVPFCVGSTTAEDGGTSSRILQPMRICDDWTINIITNRRCRKVREIEKTGHITLLYDNPNRRGYVCFSGPANIVEDVELKRAIWTPGHDRWNPGGPEDPATVFMRLRPNRIELWSVTENILPEPEGYSAAVLLRDGEGWRVTST
jgi:general stress protein 26